jgi:hypothetical protein
MAFTVDRTLQARRRSWVPLIGLLWDELSVKRTQEGMEGFGEITDTGLWSLLYS